MLKATVGIAGVGGLGSNVCVALARMGVAKLVIADYDEVEYDNLNRQAYGVSHVGQKKVTALKMILSDVNPKVKVVTHCVKVTEQNALEIFDDVDIIVEAFDNAMQKTMFIATILKHTEIPVVAGSGMAGYGSSNDIKTKRQMQRLYIAGDFVSGLECCKAMLAPRVLLVAAHQANMVARLLMGINDV